MKVLFISEKTLKEDSLINNNVDAAFINSAIMTAQDIFLQPLLGSCLYEQLQNAIIAENLTADEQKLIDEYITPYLEYRVMADIQIPLNYKFRNAGIISNTDTNIQTASLDDLKYLTDYYENRSGYYANRMTKFICKNSSKFPSCSCDKDIRINTIINLH